MGVSLPFWQLFNFDPDYFYLFNGLRLAEGVSPTDVAHPGTPVHALIALVIRGLTLGQSSPQMVDTVLGDPEAFLVASATVIYVLIGASIWVGGWAASRAFGSVWAGCMVQSAPFLSALCLKMALHPKPEPFLVIATMLLLAISFAALRSEKPKDSHAIAAGLVMGFGIITKIHFIAFGIVPLLLFTPRQIVLYGLTTPVSMAFFFAPAWQSLDLWKGWLSKVFMGAGSYGEGAQTIIDPRQYPKAILRLFAGKWVFDLGMVLSLSALTRQLWLKIARGQRLGRPMRLLAGIVISQILMILLVAKHPTPHYMIPAYMLNGGALALVWHWSISTWSTPTLHRAWQAGWGVLALALAMGTVNQVRELHRWTATTRSVDMSKFDRCAKVFFEDASSPTYAEMSGDLSAFGRYSQWLADHRPQDEYVWFLVDHVWWTHSLRNWTRTIPISDLESQYPCILYRGEHTEMNMPAPYESVCRVGGETFYGKGIDCAAALPPNGQ